MTKDDDIRAFRDKTGNYLGSAWKEDALLLDGEFNIEELELVIEILKKWKDKDDK